MEDKTSLLIRTKWLPPRIDKRVLERTHLLERLEQARERRLTLILGPAGSGKTTAASQLRRRLIASGVEVAWLNLSSDDESSWAAYLLAALEEAGVAIGNEMLSLAQRGDQRSIQLLVSLLINCIHAHVKPLYLFLDDLHLLDAPLALAAINRLIELAPANFHVLICSRERPALHLLDLGLKGQLLSLDFADLRLTYDEQLSLLALHGVEGLSGAQQRRLHDLTDGWAAGLQMSALSLRQDGDLEKILQVGGSGAAGSQSLVAAYLDDCVRRVSSPPQFEAMLRLSVCRRFCRELFLALNPGDDSSSALDVLIERNLFLLPIDSDGDVQWYRFHHMLLGYLEKQRSQLDPQALADTHRRASRWFAEQGLYVEAVWHSQHAGDPALSAELLASAARFLLGHAHFAALMQLVDSVSPALWQGHIDLLLAVGWGQLTCTRLADFPQTLDLLARHAEAGTPAVVYEVRLMRAMYLAKLDDTDGALELLEPLLADPPRHNNFHLLMLYTLCGTALLQANRGIRVRDLVREGRMVLNLVQGVRPRPFLDALHGMSLLLQGDLRNARSDLENVLGRVRGARELSADATLLIQSSLALCCYGLDDLDAAEDYLEVAIELVEMLATTDGILHAYLAQARLHHANGLVSAALATLEQLGEIGLRLGLIRLQAWACAEQVRIACRASELPMARELLRRLNTLAMPFADKRDCAWAEIPLARAMAEADLALEDGNPQRAAQLGREWLQRCQDTDQLLLSTVLRVRSAHALLQCGDLGEACTLARRALKDASENAMHRVFLDEGPAGLHLLELCSQAGELLPREQAYLERCRQRFSHAGPLPAPVSGHKPGPIKPAGANPLSPRELEIVQLLARALSTKSVARTLELSPGTVKWHLKNIFAKLDAISREDAINKARRLGLVD